MKIILSQLLLICTVTSVLPTYAASMDYQLQKESPSLHNVVFRKLTTFVREGRVFVSGTIKKRSVAAPLRHGHIDIAVYSPQGKLLSDTSAALTPSIITRRVQRGRGSRFEAELDIVPPADSVIKVIFRPGAIWRESKSDHDRYIAR